MKQATSIMMNMKKGHSHQNDVNPGSHPDIDITSSPFVPIDCGMSETDTPEVGLRD